jgi:signal transduction histidine kinase
VYYNEFFGGSKNTYLIFYPLVIFCALAGGLVSGITATLILGLGSAYFIVDPPLSFAIIQTSDIFGFIVFTLTGILTSYVWEWLHTVRRNAIRQNHQLQHVSRQLHDAKEQLQTILDNVADGIVVRDNLGNAVYANNAALQYLDIPTEARKEFIILDTLEETYDLLDEHGNKIRTKDIPVSRVLSGMKDAKATFCFKNKLTGKEFWNLSHAKGIYKDGQLQFIVTVFADITNRRILEKQKDDFLGIASHELKTPVTSLKVYTQTLQHIFRKEGNISASEKLVKMDNQINKLSSLIADLLDITKIQSGRLQFRDEYFDFNTLVNEVADDTQRTTKHHTIVKNLDTSAFTYADRNRIGQVLMNLLTNAIKYSPHADKIILTTKTTKKTITVSVQDFGEGIPKQKQTKIFERYYREMGPKDITIPGLGLGLFISAEFIRHLGGKIWVESKTGKGSTFYFSVPIRKKHAYSTVSDGEISLKDPNVFSQTNAK